MFWNLQKNTQSSTGTHERNEMDKKMMIITHIPASASSFYRAFGPLSELRPEGWSLHKPTDQFDWSDLVQNDVIFFHRPTDSMQLKIMEQSKSMGRKIWVDHDDNLLDVPPRNPGGEYARKNTEFIQECIRLADIVTTSTPDLMNLYKQYNDHVKVIPNSYWLRGMGEIPETSNNCNDIIFWRGSPTHMDDLASQAESMASLSKEESWQWRFVGEVNYVTLFMRNCVISPSVPLASYFQMIKSIKPSLWIYPLEDNDFNKGKSNIAWIEATVSGSVVIAPDFPEWRRPGVINYSDSQDFCDLVRRYMKDPSARERRFQQSKAYLEKNLTLEEANQTRLNILDELVSC